MAPERLSEYGRAPSVQEYSAPPQPEEVFSDSDEAESPLDAAFNSKPEHNTVLFEHFTDIKQARRQIWLETGYLPPIVGGSPTRYAELSTENIVRLYTEEGLTSEEIAKELGVSRQTVLDRLHKTGIEVQHGGYRWNGSGREGIGAPRKELPLEELRRLYEEENMTSKQIAEIYHCNYETVLNRLREIGVKIQSRGRRRGSK
jgi:DNA-binding CsgD family transcriptional regulator